MYKTDLWILRIHGKCFDCRQDVSKHWPAAFHSVNYVHVICSFGDKKNTRKCTRSSNEFSFYVCIVYCMTFAIYLFDLAITNYTFVFSSSSCYYSLFVSIIRLDSMPWFFTKIKTNSSQSIHNDSFDVFFFFLGMDMAVGSVRTTFVPVYGWQPFNFAFTRYTDQKKKKISNGDTNVNGNLYSVIIQCNDLGKVSCFMFECRRPTEPH